MGQEMDELRWQVELIKPRIPWKKSPLLAAELGGRLCDWMLSRENLIEDANYQKIVPNLYVVELSRENFLRNYQPINNQISEQWRDKMAEHLQTMNDRQGRKEYRFEGKLQVQIRPGDNLEENQARVFSTVIPDQDKVTVPSAPQSILQEIVAYLDLLGAGQRWPVYLGNTTIGRDESCTVFLDIPLVQEKRLISGHQAYIRCDKHDSLLFDGALSGKPSTNGTFLNSRRVNEQGSPLNDGDLIVLAAPDVRPDGTERPGTAAFRFWLLRKESV
ncbi:MAG: DUF2662 domain-containing protein [Chloroflexi bacterium]|nr:MAG: DUF2662 domain-containing protein [Chloroflexota bacterium]